MDREGRESAGHAAVVPKAVGLWAKVRQLIAESGTKTPGIADSVQALLDRERRSRQERIDQCSDEANRLACYRIASARRTRQRLYEFGYTQHDAAQALVVSDSSYQKLEQGRVPLTIGRATVLASLYGIPVESITSPLEGQALSDEMELLRLFRSLPPERGHTLVEVAQCFTNSTDSQ